jgi:hypothetical protein
MIIAFANTRTILERYKKYNGVEKLIVDITNANRGSTTVPDVEGLSTDEAL